MTYVKNDVVQWLLTHSYGQGGTVAVPSMGGQGPLPLGAFPPGIDDLLTFVADRHQTWTPDIREIDWCFLVGGPGNGKSEALRSLAQRLGATLPPRVSGQPVPRTLPTDWPTNAAALGSGLQVAFVNDASIPRQDALDDISCPGSLFADISDAIERNLQGTPTSIFINVNRGVLVEERARLHLLTNLAGEPRHRRLSAMVVMWLAGVPITAEEIIEVASPTPTRPHYGQFVIATAAHDGHPLRLCVRVVYLDMLSLLEPKPNPNGPVVDFTRNPPAVAPYVTFGRLVSRDVPRDATIAGALVYQYADSTNWQNGRCNDTTSGTLCSAHSLCPFAQNATWLQHSGLRHRFLDSLRATEIASNRRLTYRDLLGHVSLAVIGAAEEDWLRGKHPCQWVAEKHGEITSASGAHKDPSLRLAFHRIYTNLFPGGGFTVARSTVERKLKREPTAFAAIVDLLASSGEPARLQPFEAGCAEIDPCKDTETWKGLRRRILDAAEASDVVAPMDQLTQLQALPTAAMSEIERLLDRVISEEIAAEMPRGNRAARDRIHVLRRWRTTMLLRHVGLALGHLRYSTAIEAWLAEQESALQDGQRLHLGEGVNNLILPSAGGSRLFVAPLRPRTYCLTGSLPKDTLLVTVQMNELDVTITANGDTLGATIRIRNRGQLSLPLALLVIDLPVARESLLHASGRTTSFTEIGDTAFARIERARASLISRDRLRHINAWFTDDTGRLFQIISSPAGAAPLRIQEG